MTNSEKKTQRKLWFVHILLVLFVIALVFILAFDISSLWYRTHDNDSDDYVTYVMYRDADGNVVETVAQDMWQSNNAEVVQIYLDDTRLTVPVDNFVAYRDKTERYDKNVGEPSEIKITMPDGSVETVTGYAAAVDPGFTNPGNYLLRAPIYAIETADREYYCSGKNLFVSEPQK